MSTTTADVKVGWLFSMARSGSSIAVYAAAAPWGHAVADEVFGPWDRTGDLYKFPRSQFELIEAFAKAGHRIDDESASIARGLFGELGADTGFVVCKSPHVHPVPDDVRAAFPEHAMVFLLRNPLHRLNSLFARGWLKSCGPNYDLERFKEFAGWWREAEHRVVYDDLRHNPEKFYPAVWRAWGLEWTDDHLKRAVAYAGENYHDSSLMRSGRKPTKPISERKFKLPDEAIETYLKDDFVRELMESLGWSTNPADYRKRKLFG